MNYQTATKELAGRDKDRHKLDNNTYLERRGNGDIAVRLHDTDILTFKPNSDVVLDSGGWRTSATKDRLNKYLDNFSIFQDKKIWYVANDKKKTVFEDGLVIRAGKVFGGGNADNLLAVDKQIQKYVKGYMAALFELKVPKPSNGDCWFCLMHDQTNKSLGELSKDKSHIQSHLEENYFVPSLLANAFESFPVSKVAMWALYVLWHNNKKTDKDYGDLARQQLGSSLKRYLRRQMGLTA